MHTTNSNEHQDIIRILASSDKSFDEAVQNGVRQLVSGHHHQSLRFTNFEVVQMQGIIQHDDNRCEVTIFQVVMDVAGKHKHDHDH
ncbi:dodecin domain-containing protein [Pseudenhygromyxa sp. WMMC2535]|uniref:dodecin domain-containing protein n=1 Tax=Pseudenhygromyxa sp. WMMC2535 TaxID=2712867 RepID=UPI001557B8EC|nr:dodecin domain-containing protein [Pseudenhygromyxa sp. WMMC2535]NVB36909.1 dodecin domain-containing protein [Pseudenhygromyxa sp. WMMC2535]